MVALVLITNFCTIIPAASNALRITIRSCGGEYDVFLLPPEKISKPVGISPWNNEMFMATFALKPHLFNTSLILLAYFTASKSFNSALILTVLFSIRLACAHGLKFLIRIASCSWFMVRSGVADFNPARFELVKILFTSAIVAVASAKDFFASFNLAAISGLLTISRICAMLVLISTVCAVSPNTCFASSKKFVFDSSSFIESRTVSFDKTPTCKFAWLASFSACAVRSFNSADSKPEITLMPMAAIASIRTPLITIFPPRFTSVLYFSTMSPNISGLKSSGGKNLSASVSIDNPRQTTTAPQTDKTISSQNHGDSNNLISKVIYVFLVSIPNLILLASLIAISGRRIRRK